MEKQTGAIGVLGGVGPYAGLDLVRKIFDQTQASCDQEHLPVLHFSLPSIISGRPAFLLGESGENPGIVLGEIMVRLAQAGATRIGLPCNTAHSPRILHVALEKLHAEAPQAVFVHMIDATMAFLRERLPHAQRIGVLSTQAIYATGLYREALSQGGYQALFPDEAGRERVQQAISNPVFGIKAHSCPVRPEVGTLLAQEIAVLVEQGAEAILLGCTELPLALTESTLHGVPLFDTTQILARALILSFAPDCLKADCR